MSSAGVGNRDPTWPVPDSLFQEEFAIGVGAQAKEFQALAEPLDNI